MTHACCPDCRMRTPAPATDPMMCPQCGRTLELASAADVLGWPLMEQPSDPSPAAIDAAMALPDPRTPLR